MADHSTPVETIDEPSLQPTGTSNLSAVAGQHMNPSEIAPFRSQLDYLSQSHPGHSPINQYGQAVFDMSQMAGALPVGVPPPMAPRSPYSNTEGGSMHSSPNTFRPLQPMSFPPPRGSPYSDPIAIARIQQQQQQQQHQMMTGQFIPGPNTVPAMPRQPNYPVPGQIPYSPVDAYGFAIGSPQYSPIDPRFPNHVPFGMMPPTIPGRPSRDYGQSSRRSSDTAPIPTFPRGPPRKPKQSGHALWVGNLPPAAQVTDLKDHFSRDATKDIESVFLIAKSNCAFVNYRTEAACVAAMSRFHDSRFNGVRLVCRLRRGTLSSNASGNVTAEESNDAVLSSPASGVEASTTAPGSPPQLPPQPEGSPTIARSQSSQGNQPSVEGTRVPEKYYIVKSLTAGDLEASVRNGTWATQSHNEETLNRAYNTADNVYLIFSANKSGEYFGYARMASAIAGEPVNLSTLPSGGNDETLTDPTVTPQSIPTPATATAPPGRIIDDSARGTIFWEAILSEDDEDESSDRLSSSGGRTPVSGGTGQNWGRQFQIEWLSTNRLPFYRTRGLRNPWNANREVKIARDGTELEPSVGRRLVFMFNRPTPVNIPNTGIVPGVTGNLPTGL